MKRVETSVQIQKRWINPGEYEKEFGVAKATQAQQRSEGNLPYSKRGKFVYYDRLVIDKMLEDSAVVQYA